MYRQEKKGVGQEGVGDQGRFVFAFGGGSQPRIQHWIFHFACWGVVISVAVTRLRARCCQKEHVYIQLLTYQNAPRGSGGYDGLGIALLIVSRDVTHNVSL